MKTTDNITIQNFNSFETNRGLAYSADILLDGEKVADLNNPGNGSYTSINFYDKKDILHEIMYKHFEKIGMNIQEERLYALEYTFAEHLLDISEQGTVSKESLELGILH